MTSAVRSGVDGGRAARAYAGFTLIELLVAMTLFGLLAVALVGGLRFGTRVWDRGHERSAAFAEVEAVQGFLRQQLEQARLAVGTSEDPQGARGFVGGSEEVAFLAPLPRYVGLGGLYRFRLSGEDGAGSRSLVLEWTLYRPDRAEAPEEDTTQRILLEDIDGFALRYYGAVQPEDDPGWHEDWTVATRLPRMVAIEIAFPDGDLRHWPVFVAAPVAADNAASF
jgi:general secretion pathway protein J